MKLHEMKPKDILGLGFGLWFIVMVKIMGKEKFITYMLMKAAKGAWR